MVTCDIIVSKGDVLSIKSCQLSRVSRYGIGMTAAFFTIIRNGGCHSLIEYLHMNLLCIFILSHEYKYSFLYYYT